MVAKRLYFAGLALAAGAVIWSAPPARADHCYLLDNGMIYCYDRLPGHVVHQLWPVSDPPPLPDGQVWECNLMSHPRTICVSYDAGGEVPAIPKYTPGSREFDAAASPTDGSGPPEPVVAPAASAKK